MCIYVYVYIYSCIYECTCLLLGWRRGYPPGIPPLARVFARSHRLVAVVYICYLYICICTCIYLRMYMRMHLTPPWPAAASPQETCLRALLVFVGGVCLGVWGVVLVVCVCFGVGGVVLCRCVCVCDRLIFLQETCLSITPGTLPLARG